MITLDPSMPVYREIVLLATAWNTTAPEVVSRLVGHYYLTNAASVENTPTGDDSGVAVHRVYAGRRVEGRYERATSSVTITSGPLAGQFFRSPSGASAAVVTALNPGVAPSRSGWTFWIVTATGKTLSSIRYQH
jgi:hypothetical protein